MSVGILIVTHERVGEELLRTAKGILGVVPLTIACLEVSQQQDLDERRGQGQRLIAQLGADGSDGVLILADAFGSTPSNLAVTLGEPAATAVVSGVNLPMLLRVLNYPHHSLAQLQAKAVSGGRDGVVLVQPAPGTPTCVPPDEPGCRE